MNSKKWCYPALLRQVNQQGGNSVKFAMVATTSVIDVSQPSACVPPKPLKQKIIKPAINTIEVYIMLNPVDGLFVLHFL
jgi:hypothetical protein